MEGLILWTGDNAVASLEWMMDPRSVEVLGVSTGELSIKECAIFAAEGVN